MDMVSTDRPFPDVEWVEGWPEGRSVSAMAPPIILAVVFVALAITPVVGAPWSDGPVVVVGAAGMVLAFLGAAYAFVIQLPWYRFSWRSPVVRRFSDEQHGSGVELALDRRELTRFVPAMTGISVYGFCGWLDWYGGGSSLLPMSKSNDGGATMALVFSVILAVFVVFFSILPRWAMRMVILPSGIARRTPGLFGRGRFDFIPWSAIADFKPGSHSSGKARDLPAVRAILKDLSASPLNKVIDECGIMTIPIHAYKCDKNAIMSMLAFLKGNPEKTALLAHPDAPQWFLRVERSGRRDHRIRKEGRDEE